MVMQSNINLQGALPVVAQSSVYLRLVTDLWQCYILSFIDGVVNVNWPPQIFLKLKFHVLALPYLL